MKPRQLPHSLEAEQCVLAGMVLDPEALKKVVAILSVEDFYHPCHKKIFQGIVFLHDKKNPVDIVTIAHLFKNTDHLEGVGGLSYFAIMTETLPTTANIGYYAKIVKDKALRREVITRAQTLTEEAYMEESIDDLIESAQKKFTTIALPQSKPYYTIKELLKEGFEELEYLNKHEGEITGMHTGFGPLDFITGGFQKTDLIIVAGRPSMGKSSLCCQVATNMAQEGKKVGYFSIEVGKSQVIKNIFACQSRISTNKLRSGSFEDGDWGKITKTFGALYETTFSLDDMSRSSQDIIRQARRMYAEHGLDIVFIDHIQEMKEKGRFENRNNEIDAIGSNLKELAKELSIPVVVVAQLSRKVEDRGGDFKPRLSDIRDSGSLEQKADLIMFVYREEYYQKEKSQKQGIAEIIIAKHRNGALGDIELKWQKEWVRFDEIWRGTYE